MVAAVKKLSQLEPRVRVYLAGKCGGPKWNLIEGIRANFTASDYKTHGMHLDSLWSKAAGFGSHKTEILHEVIQDIADSDILVAYLDTPDSFGSIAEIAYASAHQIKCYLLIVENDFTVVNDEIERPMLDAYWFVSNFPNVEVCPVDKTTARQKIESIVAAENVRRARTEIRKCFESPLEEKFYDALMEAWKPHAPIGIGFDDGYFVAIKKDGWYVNVVPQAEVVTVLKKYRLDFLFVSGVDPSKPFKCAVEIDGHDFHEKTKEQAKRDKERDRALLAAGYTVMRFTGSEVYHNADKCVREVLAFIETKR